MSITITTGTIAPFRYAVLEGQRIVALGEASTVDQVERLARVHGADSERGQTSFAPFAWRASLAPHRVTVAWPAGCIGYENVGVRRVGEAI